MADHVEVQVTHEVVIDGEKSWIRAGYVTELQMTGTAFDEPETPQQAFNRASSIVNQKILDIIAETVETVRGAS